MTFMNASSWHVHQDLFVQEDNTYNNADKNDTRYGIAALSPHAEELEELECANAKPLRETNVNVNMNTNARNLLKPVRRLSGKYVHVPHREKPPQLVAKRNARERRRVQAVNSAFVRLRKAVPFENNRGKRVSKVKTLQYAIDYIQKLQDLLTDYNDCQNVQYYYNYYPSPNDHNQLISSDYSSSSTGSINISGINGIDGYNSITNDSFDLNY